MNYDVIPTMDMQKRPIGVLTCDEGGQILDFESATGKPSSMFTTEIGRGENMDVIRQRYANFAFVDKEQDNDGSGSTAGDSRNADGPEAGGEGTAGY